MASHIPVSYIRQMVDIVCREEQLESQTMLAGTGIDYSYLEDWRNTVNDDLQLRVYKNVVRHSSTPGVGLRLGAKHEYRDYGILSAGAASCSSVGESFAFITEFMEIHGPLIVFDYSVDNDGLVVQGKPRFPLGDIYQLAAEEVLSVWRHAALPFPGFHTFVEKITLNYKEPPHANLYREMFNCPVLFEQDNLAMYLPESILIMPLSTTNEVAANAFAEIAERKRIEIQDGGSCSSQVCDLLASKIHKSPSQTDIAKLLNMAPRTLGRRLGEEGTSYRALTRTTKEQMAKQLLYTTRLSIEQIAAATGFKSRQGFDRAFHTWTGETPKFYRTQSSRRQNNAMRS